MKFCQKKIIYGSKIETLSQKWEILSEKIIKETKREILGQKKLLMSQK